MHQHGLTHRVQREVEIHSRLKHPAILEVRSLLVKLILLEVLNNIGFLCFFLALHLF